MLKYISIAIPHYNNSNYIKECIENIINDERINEIIINDDKSSDINQLEVILNNFNNKKIKLYKNEVNLGCYHNKIKTISYCTNDWAILFDSDNILNIDFIDKLYNIKEWDSNTIYIPSWVVTFPNEPSPYLDYRKYSNIYINKEIYINNFNDNNFQCLINTCNYFLPVKNYFNLMNNYQINYKREMIDCLDSAVLFTDWLLSNGKIFVVNNLIYKHRLHEKSNYMLSTSKNYQEQVKNILLQKVLISMNK